VVNRLRHCGTLYPPCIALSQTKTAQPASQANSEPTVEPKTAAQATAEAEITPQSSQEAETTPELTEKKDTTLKPAAKRKPSSKTSARSHSWQVKVTYILSIPPYTEIIVYDNDNHLARRGIELSAARLYPSLFYYHYL
jgi:hypothetical protein